MNAAFEELAMQQHPDNVSSGVITVLCGQELCENNSARTKPSRAADLLHATTAWSFVGIARKKFSPNLHQVSDLELSQGLSGFAFAKSGEDSLLV